MVDADMERFIYDLPYVTAEERIVDIQGEYSKVFKALEAVVGHLRKFLVDHSVVPLFEKSPNAPQAPLASAQMQEHLPLQNALSDKAPWSSDKFPGNDDKAPWEIYDKAQSLIQTAQHSASDYPLSLRRESLYLDHEPQSDAQIQHPGLSSLYRSETLSGLRSTAGLGRSVTSLITQVESPHQSQHGSTQHQSHHGSTSFPNSGINEKKCKLLNWQKKVVAEGTIASIDPTALVHHVPLGTDTWKVWVDVPVEPQASVWRETSKVCNIQQAVGTTVAWHKDFIAPN